MEKLLLISLAIFYILFVYQHFRGSINQKSAISRCTVGLWLLKKKKKKDKLCQEIQEKLMTISKKIFNAIGNDYVIIPCKVLFKIPSDDLKMLTHTFTLTATRQRTQTSQKFLVITWVLSIPITADFLHFIIPIQKKNFSLILLFLKTNKQCKVTVQKLVGVTRSQTEHSFLGEQVLALIHILAQASSLAA